MTSPVLPSTFVSASTNSTQPSAIRAHGASHYSEEAELPSGSEPLLFSLIQPLQQSLSGTVPAISAGTVSDLSQPLGQLQQQTAYSNTQLSIDSFTQAASNPSIEHKGHYSATFPLNQQTLNANPLATHNVSQAIANPTSQVTTAVQSAPLHSVQSTAIKELVAGINGTQPANTHLSLATGMLKPDSATHYSGFQAATQQVSSTFAPSLIESAGIDAIDSAQATVSSRTHNTVAQWGPVSVSQSAPLLQQSHEMLSPLREQLRFQIDQQIKQAEIRLDPPELGKIELNVRLDGDRLHIQMHAANPSVRDALLMGLDRLRAELAMDHGGQIDVDISQGESQQKQPQGSSQSAIAAESFHEAQHSTADTSQQDQVDLLA
ncbi:flagellar hook-length control protein FliK [Shewanella sp. 0m-4]